MVRVSVPGRSGRSDGRRVPKPEKIPHLGKTSRSLVSKPNLSETASVYVDTNKNRTCAATSIYRSSHYHHLRLSTRLPSVKTRVRDGATENVKRFFFFTQDVHI